MKTYNIKPEYLYTWGSEAAEDTVVTEAEILRLSKEWGASVDDLMEEVTFRGEMTTYNINYHTGAGDETIAGTLESAMSAADNGAAYTQQDITISDERGQEVARRRWWGVEYDPDESDESWDDIISFGAFGYFGAWVIA